MYYHQSSSNYYGVLIQIDCGNGRAGVQWDAQEAVDIVRFIKEKCPNVVFQVMFTTASLFS